LLGSGYGRDKKRGGKIGQNGGGMEKGSTVRRREGID
jgi:hypothetical protein